MELLQNLSTPSGLLQNVNIANVLIQLGMLLIAILTMYRLNRNAYEKKQDEVKNSIELKADKTATDKMELEIKNKASIKYVDDRAKSAHDRMDKIEKRTDESIRDLHKDVKDILKIMKKE